MTHREERDRCRIEFEIPFSNVARASYGAVYTPPADACEWVGTREIQSTLLRLSLSLSCSASPPCSLSVPTVTLRALPPFPRVMSSARGTPLYLSTLSVQWIPGTVSAFLSVCVGIRELAYCAHRWHKSAEIGSFQLLRRPCDGLLSHFTKLSFKMSWIKFEKAKCINYPYTTKKHMKSNAKS